MSTDLHLVLKNRIFALIDSVQPHSRYKALVVDKHVSQIFSRVFENNDQLIDRQVSSVQVLDTRRQTEGYLEAVYIMQPTVYNIECLAADFTRQPARYACAHIFFTPGLTGDLQRKLNNSQAARYIKRLDTAYIDYWPIESQVFSLDDGFAFDVFYNPSCHSLIMGHVRHVAEQLVSVCTSLGEYPVIRFYKQPQPTTYEASVLPYMIANEFQMRLDDYARRDPNFVGISEARGRSVFLILDRSIDQFAPLLHEFTFQAMAYDLLKIKDGRMYEYETETGASNKKEKVTGIISEDDEDWIALRHLHMQEVIEHLTAKMERLRKDNPHFGNSNSGGENGGQKITVSDLQDMVAALPQFRKTRDRFALNLQMATECMEILQQRGLTDIAEVEQTTALNVEADGRKPKNLTDDVVAALASPNIGRNEKIRLLAIYALHREPGLIEADFAKLKHHCELSDNDIQLIKNMAILGHPTVKESLQVKQKKSKHSTISHYYSQATEDVYSVSRFVPGVKNIIERLIQGQLDVEKFPYTRDEPTNNMDDKDTSLEAHSSLRNPRQRARWAKTGAFQSTKQRLFVFFAGGITHSEMRAIYELNEKYPKEIILGGSQILTPGLFLKALSRMSAARNVLALPMDEPKKPIPTFLFESDRDTRKAEQQAQHQAAQSQSQKAQQHQSGLNAPSKKSSPQVPELTKVKDKKHKFKFFSKS